MPKASIRYFRCWTECRLNADMAFWAGFDPDLTLAGRLLELQRASLEQPGEAALDGVVGDIVAELP
jgi:hypothetical protein